MEREDSNRGGEKEQNRREDNWLKGRERNERETKERENERGEGGRVWVWPGVYLRKLSGSKERNDEKAKER